MIVKFSGGPMNGKRQEFPNEENWIRVSVPEPIRFDLYNQNFDPPMNIGDYARSNRRLKDGTVIFTWLGFRE